MQKLIKENLDKELADLNSANLDKSNELSQKKELLREHELEAERLKKE